MAKGSRSKRNTITYRKKQKSFQPAIFGGMVFVVLFYFIANWTPEYDPFYMYLSSTLLALYSLAVLAAFVMRLEKWYPLILHGMLIIPAAFCLFSGLKAADQVPFLQFLIGAITMACFIFGFWGETLFPRFKGKDWFTVYFFVVLAITFPPLLIFEWTMDDPLGRFTGIMKSIFGERKGTQILTYLLGFGMPPFLVMISQTIHWKIRPIVDEPSKTVSTGKST